MTEKLARGAVLVGSFPEDDPEKVFRMSAEILGDRLRRVTDGEWGERARWVTSQLARFGEHPQLEVVTREVEYGPPLMTTLKPGVKASEVVFDDLGYPEPAKESFAMFERLQSEGALPAGWKFQVSIPTPLAAIAAFVADDLQADIEPAYEARILAELDIILDAIPHDRLAIQWDTAVEFAILEELPIIHAWFPDRLVGILERLTRIGNRVPADVDLGYHLCYGEAGHKHWRDPEDMGHLVDVANGICAGVTRPVNWIHMPVLREAFEDPYYEPLSRLKLQPETELYLGLVHRTGGVDAIWRRIGVARKFVDGFGVATECGFSQRPPETVPEVLQLHAEVAEPIL